MARRVRARVVAVGRAAAAAHAADAAALHACAPAPRRTAPARRRRQSACVSRIVRAIEPPPSAAIRRPRRGAAGLQQRLAAGRRAGLSLLPARSGAALELRADGEEEPLAALRFSSMHPKGERAWLRAWLRALRHGLRLGLAAAAVRAAALTEQTEYHEGKPVCTLAVVEVRLELSLASAAFSDDDPNDAAADVAVAESLSRATPALAPAECLRQLLPLLASLTEEGEEEGEGGGGEHDVRDEIFEAVLPTEWQALADDPPGLKCSLFRRGGGRPPGRGVWRGLP